MLIPLKTQKTILACPTPEKATRGATGFRSGDLITGILIFIHNHQNIVINSAINWHTYT